LLFFVIYTFAVEAAEKNESIVLSADKAGLWGAADAKGQTIVSYKYTYVGKLEGGYFVVGLTTKNKANSQPNDYGVVDSHHNQIIPIKYSGIDYDRDFKRFKVKLEVTDKLTQSSKFGYFDEHGKVVIPVIYDYMERISNMGDEPVSIVKLNGKYGYINLISGKLMIPAEYDSLSINSLTTDAQGNGIAVALKNHQYGVISTNSVVVVPFEFANIAKRIAESEYADNPYGLLIEGQAARLKVLEKMAEDKKTGKGYSGASVNRASQHVILFSPDFSKPILQLPF
jgi:hypothetical protein